MSTLLCHSYPELFLLAKLKLCPYSTTALPPLPPAPDNRPPTSSLSESDHSRDLLPVTWTQIPESCMREGPSGTLICTAQGKSQPRLPRPRLENTQLTKSSILGTRTWNRAHWVKGMLCSLLLPKQRPKGKSRTGWERTQIPKPHAERSSCVAPGGSREM